MPCAAGLTTCNPGCADLATNPHHCGACRNQCPYYEGICDGGVCACPIDTTVCDFTCRDLATDPYNCGKCANYCAPGQDCVNGHCQ